MVELFSNFTSTLVIIGVILALGIVFEKQLIALEDRFDAYLLSLRKNNKSQNMRTQNNKKSSSKTMAKKINDQEGYAA